MLFKFSCKWVSFVAASECWTEVKYSDEDGISIMGGEEELDKLEDGDGGGRVSHSSRTHPSESKKKKRSRSAVSSHSREKNTSEVLHRWSTPSILCRLHGTPELLSSSSEVHFFKSSTSPRTFQATNQADSCHLLHTLSKSSCPLPTSPLPPPHFYRLTPNHPHSSWICVVCIPFAPFSPCYQDEDASFELLSMTNIKY